LIAQIVIGTVGLAIEGSIRCPGRGPELNPNQRRAEDSADSSVARQMTWRFERRRLCFRSDGKAVHGEPPQRISDGGCGAYVESTSECQIGMSNSKWQ